MIAGTPAITMTLPIQKPGAFETGLATRSAPSGIRAMRSRASFSSPSAETLFQQRDRARIVIDADAERLGDRSRR